LHTVGLPEQDIALAETRPSGLYVYRSHRCISGGRGPVSHGKRRWLGACFRPGYGVCLGRWPALPGRLPPASCPVPR